MKISITNRCGEANSYRAARVKSLFNVEDGSRFEAEFDLPFENDDWQIGLVVGPSGTGKTSLGGRIFGDAAAIYDPAWPKGVPIIDAIAPEGKFDEVTAALSAVGLGSVPPWLRPFEALSNGERFRAGLARLLCDRPDTVVVDEFTSVVDRQIAKIGAMAFGKAWRRGPGKVVLLTCHYDVAEWLQPDWVLNTATGEFTGRFLRRRPQFELEIIETNWSWWPLFEPHHYLKLPEMIAATCYVGLVAGEPVAHLAVSTRPGLVEARACRLVVMPEWQGAGVGIKFLNAICAAWRRGQNRYGKPMPTLFHTSHPGLASALRRDPLWAQVSAPLFGGKRSVSKTVKTSYGGHLRAVQGFRYVEGEEIRS